MLQLPCRYILATLLLYVLFASIFSSQAIAADAPPPPPAPAAPPQPTLHGYTAAQLEALLQSPDPKNRLNAILMLRDLGGKAVPWFVWGLGDDDPSVRIAAIQSLRPLGPASEPAAGPLADLLDVEPIPAVRNQIIFTLGSMGRYAAAAVPALQRLQRDGNITVRLNASQALEHILGTPLSTP